MPVKPPRCMRYLVHVAYPLSSTQRRSALDRLSRVDARDEKDKSLRRLGIKLYWLYASGRGRGKKGSRFVIHAEFRAKKGIRDRVLVQTLRRVQASLGEIVGRTTSVVFKGDACTEFAFDRREYTVVSGPRLPVRFRLDPRLARKLGKAELSEIGMTIRDSPIGVEAIELEVYKETLHVRIVTSYVSSTLRNLIRQTYNHASEISGLFVRPIR